MGATDDVASAPTHEVGPSLARARGEGVVERWSARTRALARSPSAPRDLREALARERVRARLGSLGVTPAPAPPEEATRARDLAVDVSARSAARMVLEASALRDVRRPGVVAHTWSIAESHDPLGPAPPSVGVLAYPTWDGARAGLRTEVCARARGATLVLTIDPPGGWQAGLRLVLPRDATVYGQLRAGQARVEARTRIRPGVWLRAGLIAERASETLGVGPWVGTLTLDVR